MGDLIDCMPDALKPPPQDMEAVNRAINAWKYDGAPHEMADNDPMPDIGHIQFRVRTLEDQVLRLAGIVDKLTEIVGSHRV